MNTEHDPSPAPWIQSHAFHSASEAAQRSTTLVFWITAFSMVAEIAAGYWFNSMALLADGWHMSSHALAIGLTVFAYATARRYKDDERFAFGTWKIEVLAGFTSAILLLVVAALMLFGSLERLLAPQAIHYREALVIAVLGLLVNLACAAILGRAGHHDHDHGHGRGHGHGHGHAMTPTGATRRAIASTAMPGTAMRSMGMHTATTRDTRMRTAGTIGTRT